MRARASEGVRALSHARGRRAESYEALPLARQADQPGRDERICRLRHPCPNVDPACKERASCGTTWLTWHLTIFEVGCRGRKSGVVVVRTVVSASSGHCPDGRAPGLACLDGEPRR